MVEDGVSNVGALLQYAIAQLFVYEAYHFNFCFTVKFMFIYNYVS